MLAEALRARRQPAAVFYDPERLEPTIRLLGGLPAAVELVPVAGDALASAERARLGLARDRRLGAALGRARAGRGRRCRERRASTCTRSPTPATSAPCCAPRSRSSPSARRPEPGQRPTRSGPKAVRASMGAIFGQPIARASLRAGARGARRASGDRARAGGRAAAARARPHAAAALLPRLRARRPARASSSAACDEVAHVPLRAGGAESLNVAMTATLCLYETALHRLSSPMSEPAGHDPQQAPRAPRRRCRGGRGRDRRRAPPPTSSRSCASATWAARRS